MSRTTLGGSLKLKYGSFSFSDSDVNDGQGNGMGRGSLDFSNSRIKFHTSFMDIAPGFTRIGDLSDADRANFLNQQGLRRNDLSFNYQASSVAWPSRLGARMPSPVASKPLKAVRWCIAARRRFPSAKACTCW